MLQYKNKNQKQCVQLSKERCYFIFEPQVLKPVQSRNKWKSVALTELDTNKNIAEAMSNRVIIRTIIMHAHTLYINAHLSQVAPVLYYYTVVSFTNTPTNKLRLNLLCQSCIHFFNDGIPRQSVANNCYSSEYLLYFCQVLLKI